MKTLGAFFAPGIWEHVQFCTKLLSKKGRLYKFSHGAFSQPNFE